MDGCSVIDVQSTVTEILIVCIVIISNQYVNLAGHKQPTHEIKNIYRLWTAGKTSNTN